MVVTFFRRKVAKNMRKKPICVALCYKAAASHSSGSPEFAPISPEYHLARHNKLSSHGWLGTRNESWRVAPRTSRHAWHVFITCTQRKRKCGAHSL